MPVDGSIFKSVIFAGGGNRCVWQVGFWMTVADRVGLRPDVVASVSAGACMSSLLLAGRINQGMEYFLDKAGGTLRNFYPDKLMKGERPFPHPRIYGGMLKTVLDQSALETLRQGPELRILLARPPRCLGPVSAAMVGIMLYSYEKAVTHPLHPKLPSLAGFTPEIVTAQDCRTPQELGQAILMSSCTPPFLPPMFRDGHPVLDGGLIDNVPLAALGPDEGPSLVLLTRRYHPHQIKGHRGRVYVQPSRDIPVGKWDYTNPQGVLDALRLGMSDGEMFLKGGPQALQA